MAIPPFFEPLQFVTEIVYTVIIVFFCLAIYLKTKESYDLTKHKGIRYFRDAFLLFGLSYLIRFFFFTFFFSSFKFGFLISRELLAILFMALTGYLSTIAVFYLISSSIWKQINNWYFLVTGHIVAIVLSLVSLITMSHSMSHIMLLYLQSIAIIIAIVLSFVIPKMGNKISQVKAFYVLIYIFWLINLWAIAPKGVFPFAIKLVFQMLSLIVFTIIYYKVSKWIK